MAFAVAALSAACAKEESPAPESGGRLVERTFTAGTAALTKTSLDEHLDIIWNTEDKIGVYTAGTAAPQPFGVKSLGNGGKLAEFSGLTEETSEYIAVYPYNETFSLTESSTEVTLAFPSSQKVVAGSFDPEANLSVAKATGKNLLFRNVGALLKITVGNDGIKGIKVAGKGASDVLAGQVVVGIKGGAAPTVESVVSGSASVVLTGEFSKGQSYYLVVLPGKFESGLSLSLTNSDGVTIAFSNNASLEVLRNEVIDLGTVTVPADRWIQSYVLNGKAEVEAFVAGKGEEKETVKNLTITGSDVNDSVLQSIVARVGTINGTLTLDGVGVEGEWINTENFIDNMNCNGSFVFRNIEADVNANVFQKEKFKTIHGDLIFENCPKAHIGNGGWKPFCNIEKIEGNLKLNNVSGLNGETIASLQYVGGDFCLSNIGSFWHLGGKTADLTYIGGDLVIENCGGFGEDSKYRFYGLHALTHIGGNVILNGISGYMTTNETDLANQKASLCVLRDYAESGVISPDAVVYIKKGGKELPFDSLTSCNPDSHRSYVLEGHDAVARFVENRVELKETVKDLTISGSDVTAADFTSIGNRVGAIEGRLSIDGIGSESSMLNFDWMSGFSELGGLSIKNCYVGNPNGMQNIKKISGDLVLENCPKFPNDWDPFMHLVEIGGSLRVSDWTTGFSSRFLPELKTVGGDFTLYRVASSCWDFKTENLREIGGDLNIIDCTFWENFYGFHQLTKLGGNVSIYKSEGYAQDGDGGDKWLPGTDWDLSSKKVGLVLFAVLKKEGVFRGMFTSYLWRPSGTWKYSLDEYSNKADEIIASKQ